MNPHAAELRSAVDRQSIARGIVALVKQYSGRGPTKARAYVEEHLVTVLLYETLTTLERTLSDSGNGEVASNVRETFDRAICAEAIALIESETNREVEAFMTGHAIDSDHSVLCFVLTSEPSEPSPCEDPGLGAATAT